MSKLNWNYEKIGLIYFLYTVAAATLIQLVILPYLLPHLHAGDGFLCQLDCPTFHYWAVKAAEEIHLHGWSAWEARPGDFGSSGIAAVIYALSVPKLWVMIPVNAFVHGLSGLIIIALAYRILNNFNVAIVCSLPFVLFPSSATWYAQIHQDGFSILAWLMIFYTWVMIFDPDFGGRKIYKSLGKIFICITIGYFLMWSMRPYHTRFYSVLSTMFLIASTIYFMIKSVSAKKIFWQYFVGIILILAVSLGMKSIIGGYRVWWNVIPSEEGTEIVAPSQEGTDIVEDVSYGLKNLEEITGIKMSTKTKALTAPTASLGRRVKNASRLKESTDTKRDSGQYEEEDESLEPAKSQFAFVQKTVWELGKTRDAFISQARNSNAASNIDMEVTVESFGELMRYVPRAYQIALFAPFPNTWFQPGSSEANTMMRRVSVLEMIVAYLGLVGILPLVYFFYRNMVLWILIISNMTLMLPIAIAIPNVGTVYRMRYGFFMVLVSLGYAGLLSLSARRADKRSAVFVRDRMDIDGKSS